MALKINLGNVQINQLSADQRNCGRCRHSTALRNTIWAAPPSGTPLPGRGAIHPLNTGIVPASYPAYPASTVSGNACRDSPSAARAFDSSDSATAADVRPGGIN